MKPWVFKYEWHVTQTGNFATDTKAMRVLMDDMEMKTLLLMLHCWAAGFYYHDGWEIIRTEWRNRPMDKANVYRISVVNRVTGQTPDQLIG